MSLSAAPTESFDVIVVGGGHAGCEAAITCARLGLNTALFSLNLDRIAWQPCNPETPDRGITEVIVTKHRNGPVGTVKLLFEPQYTRFRNLAA